MSLRRDSFFDTLLFALLGVFLPGEFEHREAELKGAHGELVAAGGKGIFQNIVLVFAEIFHDGLLGVLEGFGVDIMIPFFEHDDLAKNAETGVHTALLGEIFQLGMVGGR